MKVSTENDNNFGYEKKSIVVDNIPLKGTLYSKSLYIKDSIMFPINDQCI